SIATSEDGVHWGENRPAELTMGDCFRWKYQMENVQNAEGAAAYWTDQIAQHTGRYVRLTADGPGLSLFEIAFRDAEGHALPVQSLTSSGARTENGEDPTHLIDEQNTMPDVPGYMNGTYFDEIYHARTGYEHAHGMTPLETTHPPLGKVFIMWGIQIFGMTPFGWRFMGALAGVLMIPAMYMIGKVLFGKKEYAFLAAFLMAFDCMHLTQTRIATIDSFPVLFIILMYLCMFRYLQMSFHHEKLLRTLLPLALSGVFMGLGVASKWIAVYAGIGLAVLFFWSMARRAHEYLYAREQLRTNATEHRAQWQTICDRFVPATWITLLWCVLFFMVVPLAIYMLSYIPHLTADGPYTLKRLWDAQVYMFSYHSHLVDTHAFQSPWYEWPLMLKPMWYFQGKLQEPGKVSTILSFGNPAVWWTGFAALLALLWRFARHGLRLEVQTAREDLPMPMILLGFAAQYVPWMLVPRSTFIYHYFASVPFIILCIVYWARVYAERAPRMARRVALGYMAVVVVLFLAFYPLATGVVIP
ncbi:MAG: phospholipid carrier-dependent glycosyltransferase, partial [Clostridia bacterium]